MPKKKQKTKTSKKKDKKIKAKKLKKSKKTINSKNLKEIKKAPTQNQQSNNNEIIEIKKIKKQDTEKRIYKVKEFVVYPKHGIGQIMSVEKDTIAGIEISFYKIEITKEVGPGVGTCND